jgi:hypothetical protein
LGPHGRGVVICRQEVLVETWNFCDAYYVRESRVWSALREGYIRKLSARECGQGRERSGGQRRASWPVLPSYSTPAAAGINIPFSPSLSLLSPSCPHTHTAALARLRTSLACTTALARKLARAPSVSSLRVNSLPLRQSRRPDPSSRHRCQPPQLSERGHQVCP